MPSQYEMNRTPEGEEVNAGNHTERGFSRRELLTSSAFFLKISSFASKSYSRVRFSKPPRMAVF